MTLSTSDGKGVPLLHALCWIYHFTILGVLVLIPLANFLAEIDRVTKFVVRQKGLVIVIETISDKKEARTMTSTYGVVGEEKAKVPSDIGRESVHSNTFLKSKSVWLPNTWKDCTFIFTAEW
jgi:hypothetical protein